VCTYTESRWDELLAAIASINAQGHPPLETIIVIDHNAGLQERVEREVAGIVLTENVEQRGLSGARNCGVRVARGDVVAFLDDDAFAAPDWLEQLAATYADPSVVGAGGSIVPLWERGRPGWFPEEFLWVIGCTYRGMPERTAAVRNVIGANMSFRREVLESVGGFAHGIGRLGSRPIGGEETELSIRALRRWPGRTILYEPAASVRHRAPAGRGTLRYFHSRCYAAGVSKAVISKHVGAGDALATERRYAIHVLGTGVARNLADGVRRHDIDAFKRAAVIATGLAATTAGYIVGSISGRRTASAARVVAEPAASDEP
jgi:glycosyltransferase involved in cell wall biosynthesis